MDDTRAPELRVDYFGQAHNATCADVAVWQEEMAWRGWEIAPDGIFGPQSELACRDFQEAKAASVDGLVGPETWSLTWDTPVDWAELRAMHGSGRLPDEGWPEP